MITISNCRFSTADFNKLSTFIYSKYGIKLPPVKKTMLESRLQKRLTALGLSTFKDYCDFVFSPQGQQEELVHMINLVTTNKTDFFREPAHFTYLETQVLPEFIYNNSGRALKVWSAGCSSGEEVYTLAMVLSEFSEKYPLSSFSIYGTDISTHVLNKAITAIYSEERTGDIPLAFKRKYFLKSKDATKKTVRVAAQLRSRVQFERLNFMDDHFEVPGIFDIVFCRNVIIYFDKETQEKVINRLCSKLKSGGYFFLGHSESITNMQVPLVQLKPTIFQKL
jgi:chemotaxis protein methyltransferase CheR